MSLAIQPTQNYRDCYAACRAGGGSVQACEEECNALMTGAGACNVCPPDCRLHFSTCPAGCSPDCGFGGYLVADVAQTVESVTGAVYQYGTGALKAVGFAGAGLAAAAIGIIVLLVVLRR